PQPSNPMRQRKTKPKPAKIVWRISATAPLGEYIHPEDKAKKPTPPVTPAEADAAAREAEGRGWHHSSHDLARGTEVREESLDTLSDELLEQLFKRP
ncbi:MAG: hypothetical protein OEY03_16700, partial [Rhizobacter sp.]|nr:hypothetical protein [Rhizobacter sp.]